MYSTAESNVLRLAEFRIMQIHFMIKIHHLIGPLQKVKERSHKIISLYQEISQINMDIISK